LRICVADPCRNSAFTATDPFHKYQIEPAPEFERHLMKMTRCGESEAAMQADRHCVIRVDAGNHHVFAHAGGSRQELRHQRPP
jgi:hypothetical protein